MDLIHEFLKRLGYLWYILDPRDHMHDKVEDVKDYYKEVTSAYIFLIVLEQAVRLLQGKNILRINSTVSNISQGILMELAKIPIRGAELLLYTWVYNNWRICTLPWNSVWTWFFCLVSSDLCFYWAHRGGHQINILWMVHQIHHSSEDFNLTIPFRLSMFHSLALWPFYIPLAFAVPPTIYLVHFQLNVIFQFWLHTEAIKSLGILEYIFVTPSHHRVHHGRNRRCIDKNFGSLFIIWDKLFGTFEPEGKESITYGITKPLQSFGPMAVQFNHLRTIWQQLKVVPDISNKISCIYRGPGWSPGKGWLGDVKDISEPTENESKYDQQLPILLNIYVVLHTTALAIGYFLVVFNLLRISSLIFCLCGSFLLLTTIGLGRVLDLSMWAPIIEFLRCFVYFFVDIIIKHEFRGCSSLFDVCIYFFRGLFITSAVFWTFASPNVFSTCLKKQH